jgi:hypothetical protein
MIVEVMIADAVAVAMIMVLMLDGPGGGYLTVVVGPGSPYHCCASVVLNTTNSCPSDGQNGNAMNCKSNVVEFSGYELH